MSSYPPIPVHTPEEFEKMRQAGRLAALVLTYIKPFVQEGVTTEELDKKCHDFICDHGAVPAPLGYRGYPKSICTSVNHEVCHGIPGPKRLKKGDIINIDVTVILHGWHGDTSSMFFIEPIPSYAQKLINVTYECLHKAIEKVKPGVFLGDIGFTIQSHAQAHGFSVVRDFCGHGIGRVFHGPPEVLHYGKPHTGLILKEGYIFTIEPMINIGRPEVKILSDGWTAVTKDRKLSAQYEHTLGVTSEGYEIFTLTPSNNPPPL